MVNLGKFISKESKMEGYGTDMADVTRGDFDNAKSVVISDSERPPVIIYTKKKESPSDVDPPAVDPSYVDPSAVDTSAVDTSAVDTLAAGGSRRKKSKKSRKTKSGKKVKKSKKTRRR